MELRHFKYFLAVAEELHYRKAAERLFISQPGLSRQIKQLEQLLGVPLFVRDKRKVSLTPAGAYLKGEMEFVMNHIELTKKHLTMMSEGEEGELRIGFLGSAMQNVIPELLVKMDEEYPQIHTSLEEMSNIAQVNAIEKDQLDIGFVRLATAPQGMNMKPIFKDSFSVVLPKGHALNSRNFENVKQLEEENFILFSSDYSPFYYDKIMSICEDQGFSPRVSHKSVHAQTIFRLVENNLGVAIIPTTLKHGFNLDVKFIELKNIRQEAVLSILWKKENRNPVLSKVLPLWMQ